MKKILYFQCVSGISGDMCLGSLLDLGVPADYLISELKKLSLDHYTIDIKNVQKRGIGATKVDVIYNAQNDFRHLIDINNLINHSTLSDKIKKQSLTAFHKLATAEAKVHQTTIDKIHFHEVGALDAIIDIVGTFICVDYINPDKIISSSLPVGGGFVKCEHGLLPVPAPATLELLIGVPLNGNLTEGELVTPTGATIITTLTDSFLPQPSGIVTKVGYGAGTKDFDHPNILRTILIDSPESENDEIGVVKTCLDDMSGESLGFLLDKLFEIKALDCYYTPIFMKKNRPAYMLTVLFQRQHEKQIIDSLFKHSSSLGIRIFYQKRVVLNRSIHQVVLPWGKVRVKVGYLGSDTIQVSPEYDDCAQLANLHNFPLNFVFHEAINAYHKQFNK